MKKFFLIILSSLSITASACPDNKGNIIPVMKGVKEKGYEKFGFKEGDKILKINDEKLCNFKDITKLWIKAFSNQGTFTIKRGEGEQVHKIKIPKLIKD